MDPAHFELTNPKWEALIESILGEVRQRLGLEQCKLSAHLYKLLLYEKGGSPSHRAIAISRSIASPRASF